MTRTENESPIKTTRDEHDTKPRGQRHELNVISRSAWDNIPNQLPLDEDVPVLRLPETQQARDDGYYARGRSPPPFRWEDTTLQQSDEDSSGEEITYEESNQQVIAQQQDNHITTDLGVISEISDSDAANDSTPE